MREFYFKALDKSNNIIKGKILKNNKQEVVEYIKILEMIPVDVKKSNIINTNLENIGLFKKPISSKELFFICKQLAFVFSSGMHLSKGTTFIANQSKNKNIKNIFNKINTCILQGESFSAAIESQNAFPNLFISMVKASEASGEISEIMEILSKYYQNKYMKSDKILASLLYPLFIVSMMILVVILALVFVIPIYADIFASKDAELPLSTRVLINFSAFLSDNYLYLFAFCLILSTLFFRFFKSEKGKLFFDYLKLNVFFVKNIYLKNVNYRFSLVLSILYKAGVGITEALEILKEIINNKYLEKSLDNLVSEVSQGCQLSYSLSQTKYFDPLLVSMIELGEETGYFSETLDNYSKYIDFEIETQINKINKLIEPIFTIIVGVLMAFVLIALLMPSIKMTSIF